MHAENRTLILRNFEALLPRIHGEVVVDCNNIKLGDTLGLELIVCLYLPLIFEYG
jgi:hypothetical protein